MLLDRQQCLTGDLASRTVWLDVWRRRVREIAETRLRRAAENFDADADELRRRVRAEDKFRLAIASGEGRKP
jgi:hypothetical protein